MLQSRSTPSLALAVFLAACSPADEVTKESAEPTPAAIEKAPPSYEVAATYRKDGQEWRALVVGSTAELEALAESLHKESPQTRFQIFDTNEGVEAYVAWTTNYPSDQHPFPEEWVNAHHLATINPMAKVGGPKWVLQGGAAHPELPNQEILVLE